MADGKLLSNKQAVDQVRELYPLHLAEREDLNLLRRYWKGRQKLPAVIPVGTPGEVRVMARSSRVNVMPIVLNSLVQATCVDGYRAKSEAENEIVWGAWQANRMDARQAGIHRAAYAYGVSYTVVMPGEPEPVIHGVSPRSGTAIYGEDPDWPMWALERPDPRQNLWKLYDDVAVYYVEYDTTGSKPAEFIEAREHDLGVVPWVRYLDEHDLDDEDEVEPADGREIHTPTRGQIAPLMPLQDQIDLTTFDLQIGQHYGAFRQRYIIGWAAESEEQSLKVGAARIVAIKSDEPDENKDIKVGDFAQTELRGFLESREASLRHTSTISQTPVYEVVAGMANPPSAEALVALAESRDRKIDERHMSFGESHEQTFSLIGRAKGVSIASDAEVIWRDSSARAFKEAVEGLAIVAEKLQVPARELWERIPDVTRQELTRWKAAAGEKSAFEQWEALLERQAA